MQLQKNLRSDLSSIPNFAVNSLCDVEEGVRTFTWVQIINIYFKKKNIVTVGKTDYIKIIPHPHSQLSTAFIDFFDNEAYLLTIILPRSSTIKSHAVASFFCACNIEPLSQQKSQNYMFLAFMFLFKS